MKQYILQYIFSFIVKNWKAITICILLLALFAKTRYDMVLIQKAQDVSQESLKNQISAIQEIQEEEMRKREQALEEYRERLEIVEENYDFALRDLELTTREDKKKHIKDFSQDKQSLIEAFETTYGFTYVP